MSEEEVWEAYQEQRFVKTVEYVRALGREEAQERLLEVLETGPKWIRERFMREYVE